MGAARILQFPLDPSQPLFSQGADIFVAAPLKQLKQRCCQQFRGSAIGIGFELVPVFVCETKVFMQRLGQGWGLLRPVGRACSHDAQYLTKKPAYPGG